VRVRDAEGFRGWRRYVGAVASSADASAVWWGIEWDDPTRGKHDGSVVSSSGERVRHFSCAPGCGSFVKPGKVASGSTLRAAMAERYGSGGAVSAEEARAASAGSDMFVHTLRGSVLPVEFVGADKIMAQQSSSRIDKVGVARGGGYGHCAPFVTAPVAHTDVGRVGLPPAPSWHPQKPHPGGRCSPQVSLDGSNVALAGPEGEALLACPNVVELNVQNTLVCDWEEVAAIVQQLPELRLLQLSDNRLAPLVRQPSGAPFSRLHVLVLSRTGVPWTSVCALARGMPALQELHLAGNALTALVGGGREGAAAEDGDFVAGLDSLKLLNLSDNAVAGWAEVWRLSRLPALETLMLAGNPVPAVSYHGNSGGAAPAGGAAAPFKALRSLSLSSCGVCAWASVDALNDFPSLTGIRLQHNPITDALSSSRARQIVIARVAKLLSLNGSEVRPREREDAEKDYLRRCFAALGVVSAAALPPPGGEAHSALLAEHPRFEELLAQHDAPAVASGVASGERTVGSDSITVTCRSNASVSCTAPALSRKVPVTMTVGALKLLLARKFNVEAPQQALFWREGGLSHAGVSHPEALDDDARTLGFYGVPEGAEILLEDVKENLSTTKSADREREQLAAAERDRQRQEKEIAAARASLGGAGAAR
jgi:hypothetical protein